MNDHTAMTAAETEAWIEGLRARYPTEPYVDRALSRKLRLRSGPPYNAQSLEAIGGRLNAFLGRRLKAPFTVTGLRPLTGGFSKEQFSFWLESNEDGAPRRERLVLRTQAPQSAAETHRLREYQLMGALQEIVPVPQPRWIDGEGEEFENPTLICSFVDGVSRPPGDGPTDLRMFYGPAYRDRLAPQFLDMLARVHAADPSKLPLSAFEIPKAGSNEGVLKLINWWQRVWAEDAVEADPLVSLAAQWLRDHAPPIDRVSITHGDYRAGNFLFDVETGAITVLLDWELAWVGDRHLDLAYAMQPLFAEEGSNGELYLCGLATREEFLRLYAEASDLPIDPQRLRYYDVFLSWRNLVTTIAGGARCVLERKTHQDVSFAWFVTAVAPIQMSSLRRNLEAAIAHFDQPTQLISNERTRNAD